MAKHIVIVGGGMAGLSAGCHARAAGFRTTIVEHNLALGGVCTAWTRGPYTIDGCMQWLTGGPFDVLYEELGVFPRISVHVLQQFFTYRDAHTGTTIELVRDLDRLAAELSAIAPEDRDEIARVMRAARHLTPLDPGFLKPAERMSFFDRIEQVWGLRHDIGVLAHFHGSMREWSETRLKNDTVRRFFRSLAADEMPVFIVLFLLGYLARGWLSRPIGGAAALRDAVITRYHELGGDQILHATVDEIVVRNDRACGVRLADGRMLDADIVISTSSTPETVYRLLGGKWGAKETDERMKTSRFVQPIVLASFGVARPYADFPPTMVLDRMEPLDVGGHVNDRMLVRVFNDDPSFAPEGHTVVQAIVDTEYAHWASLGTNYVGEKDEVAHAIRRRLADHFPDFEDAVRLTDVATPLTFWNMARSWRGAYEAFVPKTGGLDTHVKKTLPGLGAFYMAGQWVELGGGVPTAIASGRNVVQLVCEDEKRTFPRLTG